MDDDDLLGAIEADFESADLKDRQKAMLRYAAKLTRTPDAIESADIEGLKRLGFKDADVLGLAECVAYYAYANRLANGLGIDLE